MLTTPGVYINWTQGSGVLIGLNSSRVFIETEAVAGISFPNNSTVPLNVMMASSARDLGTFDTLINVKLYLTGDPDEINTVQNIWPNQGGGLFISYDGGKTYTVFSSTYGYKTTPSTWVPLPAACLGLGGVEGILSPFSSANLVLKFVIPEQATQYQIYDIQITADFDVA